MLEVVNVCTEHSQDFFELGLLTERDFEYVLRAQAVYNEEQHMLEVVILPNMISSMY